jgi:hypothetical protein
MYFTQNTIYVHAQISQQDTFKENKPVISKNIATLLPSNPLLLQGSK